ncbi:heat shock protein HtpX [compost metagenome]
MEALSPRRPLLADGSVALATLGLPVSLLLATGLGAGLMAYAGCQHTSPTLGFAGGGLAVLSAGGLCASLVGNLLRARRSRKLADRISVEVPDEERLAVIGRLALRLGVPVPTLRAVVLDAPLAFSVLDTPPSIVVSTWTFDHLDDREWEALVAHELAHMRRGDRLYRWFGSLFWRAVQGVPGARGAWQQLDTAMEDAADRAASEVLGNDEALSSARRKFLEAEGANAPADKLIKALEPTPLPLQLAIASLGLVATLPLLPFVIVPLCMRFCGI